jgi:hypothetical protein
MLACRLAGSSTTRSMEAMASSGARRTIEEVFKLANQRVGLD